MNYFILTSSNRIAKTEISKIVKDENIEVYNYLDTSLKDILIDGDFVDLFSEKKTIIVYECDFKKDDIKLLEEFFSSEHQNNFIFVNNGSIKKIDNEHITYLDFTKYSYREYLDIGFNYLKDKGYKVEKNLLYPILESNQFNHDLFMNELDKIILYYGKPSIIKESDIKNIVSTNVSDNSNKLFSYILSKDYQKIEKLMNDLKRSKIDNSSITIILGKAFINYYNVLILSKEGKNSKEIAKELGIFEYTVNDYLKYSNRFTVSEVEEYIKKLSNIEYLNKSGNLDRNFMLYDFLLNI